MKEEERTEERDRECKKSPGAEINGGHQRKGKTTAVAREKKREEGGRHLNY